MKFLKYFLVLLVVNFGTLTFIFLVLRKGYDTYFTFEQTRAKELITGKENFDVLFIGSSRTYYHVNPRIIDSVLHVNSFNAGIDGGKILEMNMILKCYLAHHPAPKYLVTDLSAIAFNLKKGPIFNPNMYYPFLDNKIVYKTLAPYKKVALLKYLPFLQVTEWDDFLKQGALEGLAGKEKPLSPHFKGYVESGTDTIALPFKKTYLETVWPIDKKGVALLEEIIDICRKNHILLIITYSPVYKFEDEKMNPAFFPLVKHICDTSHTAFLNYRYLSINNNHKLFRDEHHLNKYGADIFSNILAADIKRLKSNHHNFSVSEISRN